MKLTRKGFLTFVAVAAGASVFGRVAAFADTATGGDATGSGDAGDGELRRIDAFQAVLRATDRYPLVGLGDNHMCEQFHVFLRSLVQRPAFQHKVDDIVVEFGNALYQHIADRFFLDLQPVDDTELAAIWRNTLGGRVYWDSPVYEQFYRTMRSVNESLPRGRRIRVVLGDVDIDWSEIRSIADADKLPTDGDREPFLANVIEREVLAKHRRALIVVGGNHLRRGIRTTSGGLVPPKDPDQPSAGTLIAHRHSNSLFVVLPFSSVSAAIQSLPRGIPDRLVQTLAPWPVPSIAAVANTWLAPQPMPDRALDLDSPFQDQADAILWLGPDEALTCARADPALYQSGAYAAELRRRSEVLTAITSQPVDLVAEGLHLAGLAPSCSER